MPARSSHSFVLRWPDRQTVERALGAWLDEEAPRHDGLRRVGYFGSYATGTWGPGSDLDLVAVVDDGPAVAGFAERASTWRTERLPVPADLLVYTQSEWLRLITGNGAFARMLNTGVVWVYCREDDDPTGPA